MLATKWHVIKTLDYSKYLHESNKRIQTCCLPKPIRCNVGIIPSSVGIDPIKPFALYSIDTNSFICPSSVGIGPVSSLKPYHNFISYHVFSQCKAHWVLHLSIRFLPHAQIDIKWHLQKTYQYSNASMTPLVLTLMELALSVHCRLICLTMIIWKVKHDKGKIGIPHTTSI